MIDLRDYLWKFSRPLADSVTTGERHRPPVNARAAAALESGRPSGQCRWPCPPARRHRGADAVLVRARLGNYQRALTSARETLQHSHPTRSFDPAGASLFTTNSDGGADSGSSAEQGGDQ